MCQGTLIQFWCPCRVDDEAHEQYGKHQRATSPMLYPFEHTTEGHNKWLETHALVKCVDTGAYNWCDQYFLSSAFRLDRVGPPSCPLGPVKYFKDTIMSKAHCDFCVEKGCTFVSRPADPFGSYGRITEGERRDEYRERKRKEMLLKLGIDAAREFLERKANWKTEEIGKDITTPAAPESIILTSQSDSSSDSEGGLISFVEFVFHDGNTEELDDSDRKQTRAP
ncbi:hypothetical protein QBC44DRAFT_382727 [Cladorrhinum sp. PSN332]|nr:hypothetical protein QBC44DRAFT_382727 [Cladorrhinum sp. PSN332]